MTASGKPGPISPDDALTALSQAYPSLFALAVKGLEARSLELRRPPTELAFSREPNRDNPSRKGLPWLTEY